MEHLEVNHMSRPQHTPGPWEYDCVPGNRWGVIRERREDGRGIADMHPSQRVVHDDKRRADTFVFSAEDAANARLIAAAPELLAAVRAVADYWAGGDVPADLDAQMRAAIAKATEVAA